MNLQAFVTKVFELHRDDLAEVIGDLTQDEVAWRPAPAANPIGFLLWHLTRVEDGWVQRVIQREKHLWVRAGWAVRFGMPEDQRDMGFDYREDQIRDFAVPSLELLRGYFDAVRAAARSTSSPRGTPMPTTRSTARPGAARWAPPRYWRSSPGR